MLIRWSIDPVLLALGSVEIRWYSLLFAAAFILGSYWGNWVFKKEKKPIEELDKLVIYLIAGTVIGARLGHCLFYDPIYYLSNPLEILKTWKGGLASHGAGIGIIASIYLYSRSRKDQSFFWVFDRTAIVIAFAGVLIRTGNFFNSEIIGKATGANWGVIFEKRDFIPRHPAQLYEAFSYLVIGAILLALYLKRKKTGSNGLLTGLGLIMIFAARFTIEFFKENQSSFEQELSLNMGQFLSIPMIILGIAILILTRNGKPLKKQ